MPFCCLFCCPITPAGQARHPARLLPAHCRRPQGVRLDQTAALPAHLLWAQLLAGCTHDKMPDKPSLCFAPPALTRHLPPCPSASCLPAAHRLPPAMAPQTRIACGLTSWITPLKAMPPPPQNAALPAPPAPPPMAPFGRGTDPNVSARLLAAPRGVCHICCAARVSGSAASRCSTQGCLPPAGLPRHSPGRPLPPSAAPLTPCPQAAAATHRRHPPAREFRPAKPRPQANRQCTHACWGVGNAMCSPNAHVTTQPCLCCPIAPAGRGPQGVRSYQTAELPPPALPARLLWAQLWAGCTHEPDKPSLCFAPPALTRHLPPCPSTPSCLQPALCPLRRPHKPELRLGRQR